MLIRAAIIALALAVSAAAWAVPVTFRFHPSGNAQTVHLAGSFNEWRADALAMERAADGAWTATVDLVPGPYQYKFVLNGNHWVADPSAPIAGPDGNNVVWVTPDGKPEVRVRGDGEVLMYALAHTPSDAVRLNRSTVRLTMRTAADDVEGVDLVLVRPRTARVSMERIGSDGLHETWAAEVDASAPLAYRFAVRDGDRAVFFAAGEGPEAAPFELDPRRLPVFETPVWARDTVWYQIFPERFYNGNPANDPVPPKGVPGWETPLTAVSGNPNDHWWGGDLDGIREKLPWLKWLGVSGLYLNPIFKGPDTHFYATTDYFKVAPELGDTRALQRLVAAAHASGMRVMLDGVFNHTSVYHPAFRDILEHQEESRYKDWYFIHRFPVLDPVTHYEGADERDIPYDGWWGIKWMPKLNATNPATERYLLDVASYWIREADVDGWRLDVANEVAPAFWRAFRKAVKREKPDAYIVGEIWDDASPWLRGDMFDSVMNYRFRGAMLDFFARRTSDADALSRSLKTIRNDYPPQATAVMFNLLGSHDTARFLTEAGGDKRRLVLATAFMLTYPGSPCIYYGDEVGMAGGGDPWNRAPMEWDPAKQDRAVLAATRLAVALRRLIPALRHPRVETLDVSRGRLIVMRRGTDDAPALVAFNAEDEARVVEIPAREMPGAVWRDAWRGGILRARDGAITLTVPPMTASILVPAGEPPQG